MASPSISVVIPCWNRAHCVAAAIDSVLDQAEGPDEVIVIDDGSTDETPQVLARYGSRIVRIRQANAGAAAARNAGVARARGEWIAFLDSDDVWLPGRMAALRRDLRTAPPESAAHVADMRYVGDGYDRCLFALTGRRASPGPARLLVDPLPFALKGVSCQSTVVRADRMVMAGGFDPSLRIYEDAALFIRLALTGPWLITGDIAAEVRRIDGDATALSGLERRRRAESRRALTASLEALLDGLPSMPPPSEAERRGLHATPAQRRALGRHVAGSLMQLADALAEAGEPLWRRVLLRAARRHPEPVRGWVKAIGPLLLGRRGFALVLRRRPGAISRA